MTPFPASSNRRGMKRSSGGTGRRLIQKIYEVDPLVCPKCQGAMRIISSIEDPSVIRAILDHLGIWLVRARPPPKTPLIRQSGEYAAVRSPSPNTR